MTFGLHEKNYIFEIKEEDIQSFPKNSIRLFGAGPECNDVSKLRLLPDRPGYNGPKREPGTYPSQGLAGNHGKTFRQVIKLWGWILKHHPECKFLIANVDFRDMEADWDEVCDVLGQPKIAISQDHSYTKRCRAWWTNIELPEDWKDGFPPVPLEPDDCMRPGRKLTKYSTMGNPCVRPLGTSWEGDSDHPGAAARRPQMAKDDLFSDPQQLHPEEAEALMCMKPGTTAGPDITNKMRMKCIGGGWDIDISKLVLRHLLPRTLEAHVDVYLAQFDRQGLSQKDRTDGEEFMKLMKKQPDEFDRIINHLDSMRLQEYCIVLGTHCDAICMSQVNNY